MKKYFIILCFCTVGFINAERQSKKISFNYDNEDLVNVINYISAQKDVNVILPMRPNEKIDAKLTWHLDKKVSLSEAWELLGTILNIAGYSLIPKDEEENSFVIVKTTKEVTREPVPLFIGTPPQDLPQSDQRIRYIYYLTNIKLEQGEGKENEIKKVLATLLPENSQAKLDKNTNAILIMAPSKDIQSVMTIIEQLDRPGFKEELEIISLEYVNARHVADLFNKNILQTGDQNRYHLGAKKDKQEGEFFSKQVRIIANERTNKLIVLGRPQAIERIKNFIDNYIDVRPDTGQSILHVYQLQYLDAASFAEVLRNIVQSKKSAEGTEQATAGSKKAVGPQRFFSDVIIEVDTPKTEGFESDAGIQPTDTEDAKLPPPKYYGGNNLIIAARNDDWKEIKKLIEQLDNPQPQVLIEVLIADLTLTDNRAIGNMFRNAAKLPMPGDFNFQSAQLIPGVVPDSFDNPQTIGVIKSGDGTVQTAADEARLFITDENGNRVDASPGEGATTVINQFEPGSTAITLNDADGKTWNITKILKVLDHNKILSHPHVISTNNKEATIKRVEWRLLEDKITTGEGGALSRANKLVPATLQVAIRPRINPIGETQEIGLVNLQIRIDIDEYKSPTDNTRITRNVTTNATVTSGDILAIGGLLSTRESNSLNETPLLSRIPIIGWFFKNRSKEKNKTNLTVFISPTIIEPRLRAGIGDYTRDYVKLSTQYAQTGNLLDSLKDPVTRWFFQSEESPTQKFSQEFLKKDEKYSARPPTPGPRLDKTGKKKSATSLIVFDKKQKAETLKGLIGTIENPFTSITEKLTARSQS